jgi:DNA-binding CsgD family transcriptional regulator
MRLPAPTGNPKFVGDRRGAHPRIAGVAGAAAPKYGPTVKRELVQRAKEQIVRLAHAGLDWVTFSTEATETLRRAIPFDRSCWHTVDPGTILFTGSLNQNVSCSGSWLAEYEYVVEDVNKWSFLARSGRLAGATSIATYGDLARCARYRSSEAHGIGDELRGSFLKDGNYWAAAGFLRDGDRPWFTEDDVHLLRALSEPLAEGFRRALLAAAVSDDEPLEEAPGVVIFDEQGHAESISPAAERWIAQLVEVPAPPAPEQSRPLQVVAARARALRAGQDPLELGARSRVQTRSGRWLLLYGSRLSGGTGGRTAVIIQPAAMHEVAPLVALAYGLTERERQITRLCMKGQSTKQMAQTLAVSAHTIQDHLKSIFEKTGVQSRGELVGQVFLEHYVPRWEELDDAPSGWFAKISAPPEANRPWEQHDHAGPVAARAP